MPAGKKGEAFRKKKAAAKAAYFLLQISPFQSTITDFALWKKDCLNFSDFVKASSCRASRSCNCADVMPSN